MTGGGELLDRFRSGRHSRFASADLGWYADLHVVSSP
jgi:hypothetical protein